MGSEVLRSLPAWARELLAEARLGHLGLLDDHDHPRVLPVTFALWDAFLWSAIDRKPKRREPARIRYLARRPDASLTVDRYVEDWADLAWVQVLGRVEILALEEGDSETPPDERSNRAVEGALAALSDKYPQYRDEPPPGPLLRLDPRRTLCWRAR